MEYKKRGLSPIIATVLLIVLTIAAVAIISGVLIPFTKKSLAESTQCTDYQSYFTFQEVFELGGKEFRYNCRAQGADNGYYNGFSVRAKTDEKLSVGLQGFDLVFSSLEGESEKISVIDGKSDDNIRYLNGSKEIRFPKSGARTYVYSSGTKKYDKMEIYPVLKNGDICPAGDEIEIVFCDPIGNENSTKSKVIGAFSNA